MRAPKRGWAVYMLECAGGALYTGATNDMSRRLEMHQRGRGAAFTRSRLPVKLVYFQRVRDRSAALRREAAIKRLSRPEKLSLVRPRVTSRRRSPSSRRRGSARRSTAP